MLRQILTGFYNQLSTYTATGECYNLIAPASATPPIGDISTEWAIGRNVKVNHKLIYAACIDCGKKRWVALKQGGPEHQRCKECGQKVVAVKLKAFHKDKHPAIYKGGFKTKQGYKVIYIKPDDFFSSMRNANGYVLEHRLIMAKHLGRYLHAWEIVHHKNHIKDDNRIENLQLVTDNRHRQITILEERIKVLEKRITHLEAENVLLRRGIDQHAWGNTDRVL